MAAIVSEVVATSSLKLSEGFTELWRPSVAVVVGYGLSFALLAQALKTFEVGTAYALWSGIGTALIVIIGVAFLSESISIAKVGGVLLIVAGVVVLNLSGGGR